MQLSAASKCYWVQNGLNQVENETQDQKSNMKFENVTGKFKRSKNFNFNF